MTAIHVSGTWVACQKWSQAPVVVPWDLPCIGCPILSAYQPSLISVSVLDWKVYDPAALAAGRKMIPRLGNVGGEWDGRCLGVLGSSRSVLWALGSSRSL